MVLPFWLLRTFFPTTHHQLANVFAPVYPIAKPETWEASLTPFLSHHIPLVTRLYFSRLLRPRLASASYRYTQCPVSQPLLAGVLPGLPTFGILKAIISGSASPSKIVGLAATAAKWLEMQILGPYPRSTESEMLGVDITICVGISPLGNSG